MGYHSVRFCASTLAHGRRIDIWPLAAHIPQMAVLPYLRRRFPRQIAGGMVALLAVVACFFSVSPAGAGEPVVDDKTAHVVSRLTFGPTPGELARVAAMGIPQFIESQLDPDSLEEPQELTDILAGFPSESMDTIRLFREYGPPSAPGQPPAAEALRRTFDRADAVVLDATKARLARAILSNRQLYELMVDFWSEHFNLGGKRGLAYLWAGSFEREAIRPHAMGKFFDLLAATAMHPAMLIARENWKNVVLREGGAPAREQLDTTYATILLTNQTLGAGGPQKAADTQALARILTGWRVGAARGEADTGGFYFDVDLHDPSDKVLLGHPIKGSGLAEGAEALRILAGHPATSRTICRKLCIYFLCDDPPASLVSRLAEVFNVTGGDIREVLRTLFTCNEFYDAKYRGGRFKSPLRQVVSSVRALGGKAADTTALAGILAGLGQPLYAAEGPEGYAGASAPWLKPDGLVNRVAFAGDLVAGRIVGLGLTGNPISQASLAETLGPLLSPDARQAVAHVSGEVGAAVLLASPDFMRY